MYRFILKPHNTQNPFPTAAPMSTLTNARITHNSLSMLFKTVDQHCTVGIIKLLKTDRVQCLALGQHSQFSTPKTLLTPEIITGLESLLLKQ